MLQNALVFVVERVHARPQSLFRKQLKSIWILLLLGFNYYAERWSQGHSEAKLYVRRKTFLPTAMTCFGELWLNCKYLFLFDCLLLLFIMLEEWKYILTCIIVDTLSLPYDSRVSTSRVKCISNASWMFDSHILRIALDPLVHNWPWHIPQSLLVGANHNLCLIHA